MELPADIAAALWRGDEFSTPSGAVVATGFPSLDQELPGGGWSVGCATELLQPQYSLAEVQLLLPAVSSLSAASRQVLVIGAPHQPFLAGWRAWGISESHVLVVGVGVLSREFGALLSKNSLRDNSLENSELRQRLSSRCDLVRFVPTGWISPRDGSKTLR